MTSDISVDEFLHENIRGIMFLGRHNYPVFFAALGPIRSARRTESFWHECFRAYRLGRAAGVEFRESERLSGASSLSVTALAQRRAGFPDRVLLLITGPRSVSKAPKQLLHNRRGFAP